MKFSCWLESSLGDLYGSTVAAFPNTTRRQYAIDPIKIVELTWTPYLGLNTLFIKGLAQNTGNGKEYNPMILFKGVQYRTNKGSSTVEIAANDGKQYLFERLSYQNSQVLVRCNCPDFSWRFNYYDHTDKSLYGQKRRKYEGQGLWAANPFSMPGMCKHIIKLGKVLDQSGVLEG